MTFVTSSNWYLTFFPLCCPSDIYLSPVNCYILSLPKETAMPPCSDKLNRTLDPLRTENRQDGFHTNVQLSVPILSSHAK